MRLPPPARVLPAPSARTLPMFAAGLAVTCLTLLTPVLGSAQAVAKPADPVSADVVGRAVVEIERLDALRSTLAATFAQTGAPVDKAAFNAVCAPVGRAMKEAAAANRWQARQIAVKYRNPANIADPEGARVMAMFARDSTLRAVTLQTTSNGSRGTRYLRRIVVGPSCLLCHGDKASRPAFVATEYPNDRAYGFRAGDLRGAYSVFIPGMR
jgi:hypothetical protein